MFNNQYFSLAMLQFECEDSTLFNYKEKLNCLKIVRDVTQSSGLWCTFPLVSAGN